MSQSQQVYQSQAARDEIAWHGHTSYAAYLEEHSVQLHDYFMRHGDPIEAKRMLTQSLGEALSGNNGD